MDVRLVQLLGSFITASSEYALARLEFAMRFDDLPSPPMLVRLPDASEETLRDVWPQAERELDAVLTFLQHVERNRKHERRAEQPYRNFGRVVRELDQYARAIRWVLAVTEKDA